jgi:endonuclease/exonuclease/phosphatase family metal-dependent hydrolase
VSIRSVKMIGVAVAVAVLAVVSAWSAPAGAAPAASHTSQKAHKSHHKAKHKTKHKTKHKAKRKPPPLGTPARERIVAVTSTSFTVALPAVAHARTYRVFASTTKSSVYVVNIKRAHRSAAASKPRIGIGRLPYTTAPYWYRVEAFAGKQHRWGPVIRSVWLRPATPAAVQVHNGATGLWLTWRGWATGYTVVQSTDPAMRANRRSYPMRGTTGQFTPYGLVAGRRYYFRVQTVNHTTGSPFSAQVSAVSAVTDRTTRVLTYNVLTSVSDGLDAGGGAGPVAVWAQRRPGVVALVKKAAPDLLMVQEGGGWSTDVHGFGGVRQVDDLVGMLPGFALARTEIPPTEHGYHRTANYVLYRTAAYEPAQDANGNEVRGYWKLDDTHTAAYQLLRTVATGARVLAVSVHLAPGAGATYDRVRQTETAELLKQSRALAAETGSRIIYAGDFNSVVNRNHAFDAVGNAMRSVGIADAYNAAARLYGAQYNSANRYLRTPPALGQSIDYVFAPPGIGVRSRSVVMSLVAGRFAGVIPSDHNPVLAEVTVPS